ncbi:MULTISPECIES: aspartate/glutamate racemase family protein [unclassified Acidovorax]|uniref:aspartate/glutamate racemase family protein n=1 Tax=unclassified Acidovorax TaxID=2684926 RepID=UPI002882FBE4|nr:MULTISPECIES: aspartate/glutamate racemase family protein [unclassified Acidovorax]
MPSILLINPNTSEATTRMMADIVRAHLHVDVVVRGVTARTGVPMIVNHAELVDSAHQVRTCWAEAGSGWDGVIVACFGDPGVAWLRQQTDAPVTGIGEAAMRDAADAGRRFGVATTTPGLAADIAACALRLGLAESYSGVRATAQEPHQLVAQPAELQAALAQAVAACIDQDGAQAVVIGGGPLGQAALALAPLFSQALVSPLVSAAHWMQQQLAGAQLHRETINGPSRIPLAASLTPKGSRP